MSRHGICLFLLLLSPALLARAQFNEPAGSAINITDPSSAPPLANKSPLLATDGHGVVVAAWEDIAVARSVDGGNNWESPVRVNELERQGKGVDHLISLASDGVNRWIVVWHRQDEIWYSLSVDGALSWSSPSQFPGADYADAGRLAVLGDSHGALAAFWSESGLGVHLAVSASGAEWTAPQMISAGPLRALARDSSGTWLVVAGASLLRRADGFQNWAQLMEVAPFAAELDPDGVVGKLAGDGRGTWLAATVRITPGVCHPDPDDADFYEWPPDLDIWYWKSTDNGLSWSNPQPVNSDAFDDNCCYECFSCTENPAACGAARKDRKPRILFDDQEACVVTWTADDASIYSARSDDLGETWSVVQYVGAPGTLVPQGTSSLINDPAHHVWLVAGIHDAFSGASEVLLSTSTTDAAWTEPRTIIADSNLRYMNATVAGFAGRLLAAYWTAQPADDHLSIALTFRRSVDGGRNWSDPVVPAPAIDLFFSDVPTVTLAGANDHRWYAIWRYGQILMRTSGDDGRTWTDATRINNESESVSPPALSANAAGTAITAWITYHPGRFGGPVSTSIQCARIRPDAVGSERSLRASDDISSGPIVGGDGNGNWVIAWGEQHGTYYLSSHIGAILYAVSGDDGRTWSDPMRIHAVEGGFMRPVDIAALSDHSWTMLAYNERATRGLYLLRSTDTGHHWGEPVRWDFDKLIRHDNFSTFIRFGPEPPRVALDIVTAHVNGHDTGSKSMFVILGENALRPIRFNGDSRDFPPLRRVQSGNPPYPFENTLPALAFDGRSSAVAVWTTASDDRASNVFVQRYDARPSTVGGNSNNNDNSGDGSLSEPGGPTCPLTAVAITLALIIVTSLCRNRVAPSVKRRN